MTDFLWDFGPGNTGGILDSALAAPLSPSIPGISNFGHLLFEVLTDPANVGEPGVAFGSTSMIGPYGAHVTFLTITPPPSIASYTL